MADRTEPTPEENSQSEPIYRLVVLVEKSGSCPFEDWLYGLRDRAAQARLLIRLLRIAEQGNFGSHRERISGAVSELKLDDGPGYRGDIASVVALWERNKDDAERFSREFRTATE